VQFLLKVKLVLVAFYEEMLLSYYCTARLCLRSAKGSTVYRLTRACVRIRSFVCSFPGSALIVHVWQRDLLRP